MPPTLKDSFCFEYGPLDDGTYWIETPSKKLININKDSLQLMIRLNDGLAPGEASDACGVAEEEIDELIKRMQKEGVIVSGGQGRIKLTKPVKDIRISPYILLWVILALAQVWYFYRRTRR